MREIDVVIVTKILCSRSDTLHQSVHKVLSQLVKVKIFLYGFRAESFTDKFKHLCTCLLHKFASFLDSLDARINSLTVAIVGQGFLARVHTRQCLCPTESPDSLAVAISRVNSRII